MIGADVMKYADDGSPNAVAEALGAIHMDNATNEIFLTVADRVMSGEALAC